MLITQLYNKSQLLNSAAKLLHKNNLYPGVGHSSYYSCFTLMLHIWVSRMGKTLNELDDSCNSLGTGKHQFLTSQIYTEINNSDKQSSFKDGRDFNDKIIQLKRLRIRADYTNEVFLYDQSNAALRLMTEITNILNKYL